MRILGVALLAAVQLGGGFGEASAEVDEVAAQSMVINLEVEVATSADAVVAHLAFDNDQTVTIPLLDRGGGVFGVRTEVEPKNYLVVFEAIGSPGALSGAVSLAELGADLPGPVVPTPGRVQSDDDGGLSAGTERIGWLALALGAASLSAFAFWALGDRRSGEDAEDESLVEQ